ncbi:MAG TPA: hypothetical protein VLB44_26855 [Kofleriaceae bacterium]|nr:hypothetical protein [Kofleriaceae bacterium]
MKWGTFILAALCAASGSRANAAPAVDDLLAQAAARSAARDHAGAIALYREAYGLASDPHLLTLIADEFRLAGKPREALQYYCSYMYVAAAGDDADLASQHARELSAKLGKPAASDHDACSDKPATATSVTGVDALDIDLPPPGPIISKREIAGLSMLAASIGGLGVALYEGHEVARVRSAQRANDPTVDQDALQAQAESHALKQKLWLAGSGVTLLTGGILYVIGRNERHKAEKAMIAPTVNKNGGGLVVGRRF